MTEFPLYQSEAQISRKVLGAARFEEWKGLAVIWERQGLPPIDMETGCRYWPAVELWFQAKHRVVVLPPGRPGKPDGVELPFLPRKKRPGFDPSKV
jgi:hypothetical protein